MVPLRLQSRAAGHKLTKLLKEHILVAVNVLVAARSGDKNKLTQAEAAWSANGRQIADFLHAADPSFLSRDAARTMMKVHLNQVILQQLMNSVLNQTQPTPAHSQPISATSSRWRT